MIISFRCRDGDARQQASAARQPLLPGDLESTGPKPPKSRPENAWYFALGKSIAFVWPKTFWLRVRAFTCVGLIAVIRVLNLVGPACYGRMVDRLSEVTQKAGEDPPELFTFKAVFMPWVFAYLVTRFLQGGSALLPCPSPLARHSQCAPFSGRPPCKPLAVRSCPSPAPLQATLTALLLQPPCTPLSVHENKVPCAQVG